MKKKKRNGGKTWTRNFFSPHLELIGNRPLGRARGVGTCNHTFGEGIQKKKKNRNRNVHLAKKQVGGSEAVWRRGRKLKARRHHVDKGRHSSKDARLCGKERKKKNEKDSIGENLFWGKKKRRSWGGEWYLTVPQGESDMLSPRSTCPNDE